MQEKIKQGGAICDKCAIANGAKAPEDLGCGLWVDNCMICDEQTLCSDTSDWDWSFPKDSLHSIAEKLATEALIADEYRS